MRIAVCDDEKYQTDLTLEHIEAWRKKRGKPVVVYTYHSAEEFLFSWSGERTFDLIFLDIKMNSMTGIELAKIIRKSDDQIIIIFVTGFLDYVFQGYDLQAFQYLIKPSNSSRYFECLDKTSEIISQRYKETFLFSTQGQKMRLLYNDIYLFEMRSHYIEITSTKGIYLFKKKIDELELELQGSHFIRCHRSYMVNIHYVNTIKKNETVLDNGRNIPISNSRWKEINEAFLRYYARKAGI